LFHIVGDVRRERQHDIFHLEDVGSRLDIALREPGGSKLEDRDRVGADRFQQGTFVYMTDVISCGFCAGRPAFLKSSIACARSDR
jgi:hypothetical protein